MVQNCSRAANFPGHRGARYTGTDNSPIEASDWQAHKLDRLKVPTPLSLQLLPHYISTPLCPTWRHHLSVVESVALRPKYCKRKPHRSDYRV
ncbi:hypothetical protein RSOLAG1IB_00809 [Rhizoctonia solani AG-1 IB]|uniref:Uncharacterized protein n=1 Tax=Thanatephorus cucumeris (strain AG1-IB / isolate 7/3/14) TaxID=1108050 RepID=A0A0B7F5R6_THACB|nr:hypothetical protein RSOLAG1IB_00809 [Rhizoctonia solani AG-1 IB]